MASSIINSDDGVISGTSGLKSTGGDDGVLKIQNNGVDAITVADDGEVTFAAGLAIASPIVFPAGTASLPAITTTGDLNTGIYFPAADTIGFAEGGAQCGEFDSSANFKFNSGYGSVATAYGCRAWVNFDGTSNSANLTGTYSQSGTTVTVTITAHGYITGNSAYLDFTSGTAVDGDYTVTVVDANTFTVTQASRTTSGNVTDRRSTIRASGNVSSIADNALGNYTVNFTTAMPDANYGVAGAAQSLSSGYIVHIYATNSDPSPLTTTSFPIQVRADSGSANDTSTVCVSVFR